MNKYYSMLDKILAGGKVQHNKKGSIKYLLNEQLHLTPADLLNEQLHLTPADLLDIFEGHNIARRKLKSELQLFMQGEREVAKYREAGINWWDYCGSIFVNRRCGARAETVCGLCRAARMMAKQIDLPLKSITLNLGNVHVYENNVERTHQLLGGNEDVRFELNV